MERNDHTLTSYCALVHKTSEHDEHLYVADAVEFELLLQLLRRVFLWRAKAATLERINI